jgi:hypothetical protein
MSNRVCFEFVVFDASNNDLRIQKLYSKRNVA